MFALTLLKTSEAASLLVGLRHPAGAIEALEQTFYDVAEPTHPRYQQYLSREELAAIVAADDTTFAAAKAWLVNDLGASNVVLTPSGDALTATVALAHAPAIPAALRAAHIDYAILREEKAQDMAMSSTKRRPLTKALDSTLGPAAQKKAYNVPASLVATNTSNLQMVWGASVWGACLVSAHNNSGGVLSSSHAPPSPAPPLPLTHHPAGTGTFGYRPDDLALFYSTYAPTGTDLKLVTLDIDNKWKGETGKNFVEGMLDVSYITAFAPGVRTIVANTNNTASTEAGEDFGTAMLSFLATLNGRFEIPHVLSLSLGSLSFGSCDKVCTALAAGSSHTYPQCWAYLQTQFQACMFGDATVVTRIETELMKIGLRGTTVTAASGDGASHFAFGPFQQGIGTALNAIICKSMQMPVYPTSSPFVLSVGGLEWSSDDMYGPTCSSAAPCGWDSGGGGFGWTVGAAPYQNTTVPAYIAKANALAPKTMAVDGTYDKSQRAYPDVATLAQFGIPLCDYGGCSGSGGTSASAPTMAGMLSLINDARLNAQQPSLGFINTKLYQVR